jgi:NAD(P)H-dependent FMN reductase
MHTLIISSSLRKGSRGKKLAEAMALCLQDKNSSFELLDLAEYDLPLCDGEKCYENPLVKVVTEKISRAQSLVFAFPVYNYAASAATKNLIELANDALYNKVVGFLVAAGGARSYMASLSLATSLMTEFRCLIVPKFVYVDQSEYHDIHSEIPKQLKERIQELASTISSLSSAWVKINS